jgi:hypothetical protein
MFKVQSLQTNYISLYTSVVKDGAPITTLERDPLGARRHGEYRIVSSSVAAR